MDNDDLTNDGDDESNRDQDKSANEELDFRLAKTHQAYYDAGKLYGKTTLTHLFLLSIATILVCGIGIEQRVTLPFLSVMVDQRYAAMITVVLSSAAGFWTASTLMHYRFLGESMRLLFDKRYNQPFNFWQFGYPQSTVFAAITLQQLGQDRRFYRCIYYIITVVSVVLFWATHMLPVVLVWAILGGFNSSWWLRLAFCGLAVLCQLPSLTMITVALSPDRRMESLKYLDRMAASGKLRKQIFPR